MLWSHGNIRAEIFLLDHCDPHVTFVCKPNNWIAKMEFSMVLPTYIKLLSVKPKANAPSNALMNTLAGELLARLGLCRAEWWRIHGAVCLDNKPVSRLANGDAQFGPGGAGQPGQIVAKSGKYLAARNEVEALIRWSDKTSSLATLRP